MFLTLRRSAAISSFRSRFSRRVVSTLALSLFVSDCTQAVVVRGRLTDALGKGQPGGVVRLTVDGRVLAFVYAGADGSYEIRYAEGGRFTLVGIAPGFLPGIGTDFYGGASDVVQKDVVVALNTVKQEISVTATGLPTPLAQLTSPVSVLAPEAFDLRLGVTEDMRQIPGAFLVQSGQTGGVTSLFMRGGNSTANLVLIDGVPAGDIGGTFDFGTVSSTAVGQIEMYRGPNSAMYGTDAASSVVTITTPRGTTLEPAFTYSGDAGNLHTWRNEFTAGGAYRRIDYFGAISRLDTSNALPLDRYHSVTSAINLGYDFNGNTSLRATIRNADSVGGLPSAHDFYGISSNARQGDQDLYAGATLENRLQGGWHNLVRYGIARKREQEHLLTNVGLAVTPFPGFTEYFGNVVTIRGANGYSATGQASFFLPNEDQDSNRDQVYYQSDYSLSKHFSGLFGFRYDNERGSFNDSDFAEHRTVKRTNYEYNLQFQGGFWDRLFYSAGGAVEKNHLYGIAGTPKIGLAYVPVRSSNRFLRGTRLRANAATGVQEPTLALEFAGLYDQLTPAQRSSLHVGKQTAERSRTYDFGLDQNVLGQKLVVKLGYFHNIFDRQLEAVDSDQLQQLLGLPAGPPSTIFEAYVNSLAYRAQGEEVELQWRPARTVLIRGGYTHLDAKVIQSFSSDEENLAFGPVNPSFPTIAIGAEGPLVGGRPFRRAPNTGFFDVLYTKNKLTMVFKGALASRSDDSTFLDFEDLNGGNSLVLPNRDLDYGYAKLDLGGTYAWKHGISLFAQVENLLNNQHIGPIGYPGLPLTFRSGLKMRFGGQ